MSEVSEDLEAELLDLYECLDDRDRRILELEEAIESGARADDDDGDGDRSILAADKWHHDRDRRILELEESGVELKAQLHQSRLDNTFLTQEKQDLEDQVTTQRAQLTNQKERLSTAERQSEDAKKQQKNGSSEQYRLELENQTLRDAVKELEENEEDLVTEVETIASEKQELELGCRSISEKKAQLQADLDAQIKAYTESNNEKTELQGKLKAALDKQEQLQGQSEQEKETLERDLSTLRNELKKEREKNAAIEAKIALSVGAQKQKALEKEVGSLRQQAQRVRDELNTCAGDKEQLEQDLESTCKALVEARRDHDERLQDAIAKERQGVKGLESKLDAATRKEEELKARCSDLESQKGDVDTRLRRADERNSWYEEGHGLAEAVRYQKKLEADIRRRDYDLKLLRIRLGEELDRCQLLQRTCEYLRENAGLENEPIFDDKEVKEAMRANKNQMECENAELTRQIDNLEIDRLKLLKQLRHNAAQIGDKGIKFLGLDASQILKVTEFASNLRDGSVALPLNDRSMELTAELVALKAERESDKVTIERLERDIIGFGGNDVDQNQAASELSIMRQVLQDIQGQNNKLRDEMSAMTERAAMSAPQNASAEDVLPPMVRQRARDILGEPLVEMPSAALVQVLFLVKEFDKVGEELSVMRTSLQRWSKEKQEKHAVAERATSSVTKSVAPVNVPRTVAGQGVLKDKLALLNLPPDSSLSEDIGSITRQLVHCLEQLTNREQDMDDQEELFKQYDSHFSSMREQVSALYKDHIRAAKDAKTVESALRKELDESVSERKKLAVLAREKEGNDDLIRALQDELSSVKEAAQLRMKQLKQLLDEKNKAIGRYKQKMVDSQQSSSQKGETRSENPNNSQTSDADTETVERLRQAVKKVDLDCGSSTASESRMALIRQVDALATLVREKEEKINRLEATLRDAEIGKSRSEARCRAALEEMERIKGDMQSLAAQVQDSEGRIVEFRAAARQIDELQLQLERKETKMLRLSSQVDTLKAEVTKESADESDEAKISNLTAEKEKTKRALTATRIAKRKCEQELEQSKKEYVVASNDISRMGKEIEKLKRVAIDARTDKENASSMAARALSKLKGLKDNEQQQKCDREKVQELEKKVSSLVRKNAALRGTLASKQSEEGKNCKGGKPSRGAATLPRPATSVGTKEETRIRVLEQRLDEKSGECSKLHKALAERRARENGSDINELKSSVKTLERDNKRLQRLLNEKQASSKEESSEQIEELKSQLRGFKNEISNLKVAPKIADKTDGERRECRSLKNQLSRVERENEELATKVRAVSLAEQKQASCMVALKAENERLSHELHAFDLDFFEEVEDLKYKYAALSS